MPELPEVETVRAGLDRHVVGRTISGVEVLHPRPVRRDHRGPAGFATALLEENSSFRAPITRDLGSQFRIFRGSQFPLFSPVQNPCTSGWEAELRLRG